MTTTTNRPSVHAPSSNLPDTSNNTPPADRLRAMSAAMRVSFTWYGTRKSLTSPQKQQAAASFGAEGAFLSAGKKLLDTRHPAYKAVTSVRTRAVSYFKGISLPFPEPGVRLIRQSDVDMISQQMQTFSVELDEAAGELDEQFSALKSAASQRLGDLFDPSDYPASLIGMFDVTWDFPSIEPPSYLWHLSPELYHRECERVATRFDEAVQLAEQAFTEELARLVSHLTDRLAGTDDGQPKVFRDSAITNLTEFFERFRHLNIRSNEQVDQLVSQAQGIVRGIEPQALRDSQTLRQNVATQLSSVQSVLDGLLIDRPRRNVIRPRK